ncbi:MAG: polysaccharide deacetylase family protein [Ruminococcaceae bacterium]|nr:polysaccharide deacetylase family protein [Oscillospiraceae bacterium]
MKRKVFAALCIPGTICITGLILFYIIGLHSPKIISVSGQGTKLPILMYHHVLRNQNMWGKFVISPQELEADFNYLKEQGYETVGVRDVIDYVHSGIPLPQKPIMITFDDGYLSFCEYVMPLLEQYHYKAVLSVIGKHSDIYTEKKDRNVAYAHVNWQDVAYLAESGYVDVENHSYNLHELSVRKGSQQMKNEPASTYQKTLAEDLKKTQDRIMEATGEYSLCYTYPYGFISETSRPVIEQLGFQMTLSCREGINFLTRDAACLFELFRFNRPHGRSAELILKTALNQTK